ncbi:MAG: hypothetical protein GOV01_01125 [Candidatus Altiarchaeota archaeon]|nr:hypothetical protein [Candidatus Altiarchaeota archaeon]
MNARLEDQKLKMANKLGNVKNTSIEQFEGRVETSEGFDLYFRKFNNLKPKSGPSRGGLVAIHGTSSSGATFKDAVQPLMKTYEWILTPDTPGHGKSYSIEGDVSVDMFSNAIAELVTTALADPEIFDESPINRDYIITANSGHASFALINYYQNLENQAIGVRNEDGRVLGAILSGPVYNPCHTFLGRTAPIVIGALKRLPERFNVGTWTTRRYANNFASNEKEKEIQLTRKVEVGNKTLYADVKAMEDFYWTHVNEDGSHIPLVDDRMNVGIIHSPNDNLAKISEEKMREIHGDGIIYYRLDKHIGHHPHKQNPQEYALMHGAFGHIFKDMSNLRKAGVELNMSTLTDEFCTILESSYAQIA